MAITTSYGTWLNAVGDSLTVEEHVVTCLGDLAGRFDVPAVAAEFRKAVNDALPEGVSLLGDEFIGPFHGADHTDLDLADVIAGIDIWKIIEAHDVEGDER